jgi:hypothetical protein
MDSEPTLPERPQRRRFTTAYKLAVVEKYDALSHGDKGALLRREGLYSASGAVRAMPAARWSRSEVEEGPDVSRPWRARPGDPPPSSREPSR